MAERHLLESGITDSTMLAEWLTQHIEDLDENYSD